MLPARIYLRRLLIIFIYSIFIFTLSPPPPAKAVDPIPSPDCSLTVPAVLDFGRFPFNLASNIRFLHSAVSLKCSQFDANEKVSYCITLTPQRADGGINYPTLFLYNISKHWLIVYFALKDSYDITWGNPQLGGNYPPKGLAGSITMNSFGAGSADAPFDVRLNPYSFGSPPGFIRIYLSPISIIIMQMPLLTHSNYAPPPRRPIQRPGSIII